MPSSPASFALFKQTTETPPDLSYYWLEISFIIKFSFKKYYFMYKSLKIT